MMFTSARLKLTAWYFAMVALLSVSISLLFYLQTDRVLQREYDRIDNRLQHEVFQNRRGEVFLPALPPPPLARRILPEDLTTARQQILLRLAGINLLIIFVFTGLGYWWAGRTLAPLEAVHQAQQRFVTDAAHELRTPLTALKTSLEVNLMQPKLTAPTKKILQENLTDVQGLEQLVQSLLSLSQSASSKLVLVPVPSQTVADHAFKLVKPLAAQKHIMLTQKISPDAVTVLSQAETLTEVLVIFLDNAVKYSDEKTEIALKVTKVTRGVKFAVRDHGIGLSAKQQAHIFERFYRADAARNKQDAAGFGLGLAIALQLATALKGEISVESELGKGSCFSITLPQV